MKILNTLVVISKLDLRGVLKQEVSYCLNQRLHSLLGRAILRDLAIAKLLLQNIREALLIQPVEIMNRSTSSTDKCRIQHRLQVAGKEIDHQFFLHRRVIVIQPLQKSGLNAIID